MRLRFALSLLAPCFALACGALGSNGTPPAPGPADAALPAKDTGRPPEECEMSASLPEPPEAKPCVDRKGAPCVPGGWFCLARWSPYWNSDSGDACVSSNTKRAPKKLVWIDSYQLDAYEVSNETFKANQSQIPTPSLFCDDQRSDFDPAMPPADLREPTGWRSDEINPGREKHPRACIIRALAATYCKRIGGRLPTALEYMRAGQREAPSLRRFPWGDELPYTKDGAACPAKSGFVPNRDLGVPYTSPVDNFAGDRGPYGHYSLASNVGEWVSTCLEDLEDADLASSAPTIVDGKAVTKEACEKKVLVAGLAYNRFVAQGLTEVVVSNGRGTAFTGVGLGSLSFDFVSTGGKDPEISFFANEVRPAGNEFISNQVGFRCAYDLP
jgi:formylglycine-generating enzyme required for sulfatase activity